MGAPFTDFSTPTVSFRLVDGSMVLGHGPPQLNVWSFADALLMPFANPAGAKESADQTGVNFALMQGIKDTGGTFEVMRC